MWLFGLPSVAPASGARYSHLFISISLLYYLFFTIPDLVSFYVAIWAPFGRPCERSEIFSFIYFYFFIILFIFYNSRPRKLLCGYLGSLRSPLRAERDILIYLFLFLYYTIYFLQIPTLCAFMWLFGLPSVAPAS